jgi:hypothetical protein
LHADSNNGIFVLFVGSLGCIKPEIDGPESPKLIKFKEALVPEQIPSPKTVCYTDTAILQQGTSYIAPAS